MENKDKNIPDGSYDASSTSSFGGLHEAPADPNALSLEQPLSQYIEGTLPTKRKSLLLRLFKRVNLLWLVLLLAGIGSAFYALNHQQEDRGGLSVADKFGSVELPLGELLNGQETTLQGAASITLNGRLQLNDALLLSPSLQPIGAKAGQIYYDRLTNQLAYFNGETFVFLTGPTVAAAAGLQSLEGVTGRLTLGNGLSIAGAQVENTGVLSVQGQSGAVNLTAGPGIVINGTNFSNGGVVSIAASTSNVTVENDGSGNVTIGVVTGGGGSGTVTSSGGGAGRLPLFTGPQNIEDSIISQSGLTVSLAGDLSVTGSLSLGTTLSVSNGGTGTTGFTANGVLVGNGIGALSSAVAVGAGLCLVSTAGAPTWSLCPGGGGAGVTSLNALTGALNVANASASGSTITIDDASAANKGIASFNSTNFSVSSGAVNTAQDLHSGATPTFAGVNTNVLTPSASLTIGVSAQTALLQGSTTTITSNGAGNNIVLNSAASIELQDNTNVTGNVTAGGDVAVNGGDLTSTGALNITSGGTLAVGAASQTLILQGGAATSFRASSGSNTTVVAFTNPVANTTLSFPALAAGTYTICTSSGNCAGSGVTLQAAYDNSSNPEFILDATRGALTIRDNATPLGANLLEVQNNTGNVTYLGVTSSGIAVTGTATVNGNVNTSGGTLQTNGLTRIDNAGNAVNLGSLTLSGAISGGTTFTGSGNINSTGGSIQTNNTTRIDNAGNLVNITSITATGNATLQGGLLTVGTVGQAGSIVLSDGSSNNATLQIAALGQNTVYTLPDPGGASATICLTTGNCAGTGGGVTTPGGTTDRLAKFTGGQAVGDSTISDNGTTVTTTADLVVQGGNITAGTASQTGAFILHDGNGQTTTIQAGDSTGNLTFIFPASSGASNQCIKKSIGNQLVFDDCDGGASGSSATLQSAYDAGNALTTTDARNLSFTLANTANDASFSVAVATGSTGFFTVTRADGAGGADPAQLVLIDNLDTDRAQPVGLKIQSAAGGLTTAIDVSDNEISTAINIGTNDILSNGITISSTEFNLLDGHDVPLVDTNDAVATAITGTGALNLGSITNGFGAIDTGTDNITTAGTVGAGTLSVSGNGSIGGTFDVTSTTTLNGALVANGSTTLGNATTDRLTIMAQLLGASPLVFQGSTDDGFSTILSITDPTANRTITLPDDTGTVCLQNSLNCGFALSSGSGNYIQNQSTVNQSADFRITGTGQANTSLLTPLLDTATAVALNIGSTATAINLNKNTSVTGSLSVTSNINSSGGSLQTNGTSRVDGSGNLINIGNITGTGALNVQSGGATGLTVDAGGAAAVNVGNTNASAIVLARTGVQTTIQGSAVFNEGAIIGNGAGSDYLEFAEEAGNPACAAGDYRIWANSSDGRFKKCQNGTVTDLDIVGGGGGTLQNAYDTGNTILTTTARDIAFTLADTATDANFTVSVADNATSNIQFTRANGAGTNSPTNLVLIRNHDTDQAISNGLAIQAAAGGITDGLDVSDTDLLNAINIGDNNILTGSATIASAELNLLDGHDVALVDTNDAVSTAIVGTGALNAGSITNGFGAIDTGADTISTTGTINAGVLSATGSASVGGTLGVTGTATLSGDLSANGNTAIGNATTDRLTVTAHLLGASPLVFQGATDNGFETTLAVVDPTADRTITLPNEDGTVCLQNSTNCGFAAASGSGNYIQNQSGSDQTADFRISGTGRANTSLLTPLLDTATAIALNIGTTNASVINLNKNASITGTATVSGNINTSGGGLQTNSATRVDNSGNLVNIGNITGSGALALQSGGATTLTLDAGGSAAVNIGATNANAVSIARAGIQITLQGSATFNERLTVGNGAGNDYLELAEEAGNPACAAGDYRIWANSSDGTIKKCQNGTITNLDTTGSVSLQDAYNIGNTITTTNARDLAFTLADTTTDSNLTITTASSSTSQTRFILADGSGNTPPSELVLIDMQDTNLTLANGLTVSVATGGVITDGVDASDAEIVNALNIGDNNILTGSATIASAELNLLDGHDVALVDTNDAVSTAIVGTGALNAGSITNGFGAIDVGVDTISTTGAITGGTINATSNLQTNGTTRVDSSGNLTDIGNITGTGAMTIASSGAGNDITINGADQFIVQDAAVFNAQTSFNSDTSFNLVGNQNVDITSLVTSTSSVNVFDINLTNTTSSGTQQLISLQNSGGTGTTEAFMLMHNAGVTNGVTNGLQITSAAGGITTALDVSDSDIGTALSFGANDITGTNFSVTGSSGNVTSGTINGQTISSAANFTGTLAVTTLGGAGSTALCRNGSNQIATCAANPNGVTLQQAYDAGNAITTTDARNVSITLADTATDSNFLVDLQCDTSCGANGRFAVQDDGTDVFSIGPAGGAALFKGANSGTAFQVQKSDATPVLTVDTSNSRVGIGNVTPAYALDVAGDANISTGSAYKINGSNVLAASALSFTAASTATIQSAASQALNVTANAASTWSTSAGNLTLQAAGTNTLALDTGGAGTVALGNTNAATISIGSNAVVHTINIGTGAAVQTIAIGSTTGASTTTIQAGTGNLNLSTNSASASIIAKSNTNGTNAFQVQNAGGTAVLGVDTVNSRTLMRAGADSAVLGSEMITSNNFSADWTGTGWTRGASSATHTSGTTSLSPTAALSVTAGITYQIVFTITGMSGGQLVPNIGGASGHTIWSNATHTQTILASGTGNLAFTPTTDFDGTISAVSVKAISTYFNTLAFLDSSGITAQSIRTGTSSSANLFFGNSSGSSNMPNSGDLSGYGNTAFGDRALQGNVTGKYNTAIGNLALNGNTTGSDNVGLGRNALANNTIGDQNIALGGAALYYLNGGSSNTGIGYRSLNAIVSGSYNIGIGQNAGYIDNDGFYTYGDLQNTTTIGSYAQAQADNVLILGGAGSHAVNVGIGTTRPDNVFSVSPVQYSVGTASQSGTTVTGSGTTFTNAMVGGRLVFIGGAIATITAFNSTTSLTVTPSQTVSGQAYRIHYQGFQVTSSGKVGIGISSPSSTLHLDQGPHASTLIQFTNGSATGQTATDGFMVGTDQLGGAYVLNFENTPIILATNGTARMKIAAGGNVGIGGDFEAAQELEVNGDIRLDANGAGTIFGLCHSGTDSDGTFTDRDIVACNNTGVNDYAENYPTENNVGFGEIVTIGRESVKVNAGDGYGNKQEGRDFMIPKLAKSTRPYQSTVIGVTSKNFTDFTSLGKKDIPAKHHPMPVALNGRVPVKVSSENGPIMPGDPLTTSSIPGVAMKATQPGMVIGRALASYRGSGLGQVMVFVGNYFYTPPASGTQGSSGQSIQNGGNAQLATLNVSGHTTLATLRVTGDALFDGEVQVRTLVAQQELRVNGHLISGGDTPAITATRGQVSIEGTDTAGTITMTPAGPDPGELAQVTFAKPYSTTPRVTMSGINAAGAKLQVYLEKSATGFKVRTDSPLTSGVAYQYDYIVIQ